MEEEEEESVKITTVLKIPATCYVQQFDMPLWMKTGQQEEGTEGAEGAGANTSRENASIDGISRLGKSVMNENVNANEKNANKKKGKAIEKL